MEGKTYVDLLRKIELFSLLDEPALHTLAKSMKEVSIDPDEMLFEKGDIGDSMYVILDGHVRIHDQVYDFATLGKDQFFGEYALIDRQERSASATAVGATRLLRLLKSDFDEMVVAHPEIKDKIMSLLLSQLRLRNDWEEHLALKNKKIERQNQELSELNTKIEQQRDEIRAQRDLKNRFFSIISHDLRGPVSSFQGITSIINLYIKNQRYDDLLSMTEEIDHTVVHLSRLLDNLLQWASMEQSQIPYQPSHIDLFKMMEDLLGTFRASAKSKKVAIQHAVMPGETAWADFNTTTTIFRNLIHNALKFSNEGGVISIKSQIREGMRQLTVHDTGVGIKPEKAANLFDKTSQKSTFGTQGEKGVGLGLQLVHEFVRLNHGTIDVTSREGEGSAFTVGLPIEASPTGR